MILIISKTKHITINFAIQSPQPLHHRDTNKNLQNVDYWWLLHENAVELGAQPGMVINPKYADALKKATLKVGNRTVSVFNRVNELLLAMSRAKPTFDPFTGPITDRYGVTRVAAGKTMTIGELNEMQWVVPGVTGTIADEPK